MQNRFRQITPEPLFAQGSSSEHDIPRRESPPSPGFDEEFRIDAVFDIGPAPPTRQSPSQKSPWKTSQHAQSPEKESAWRFDRPQSHRSTDVEKTDTHSPAPPRDYYDDFMDEFEAYINSGAVIIEDDVD